MGPMPVDSFSGAKYILTITDIHTRYLWTFPLQSKSDTAAAVARWLTEMRGSFGRYPGAFRSDNGGEFSSTFFERLLMERGVQKQTSAPYTPQQNGVSERVNRTLLDMVRAMIKQSQTPPAIWAEAMRHATWLKNRTYASAVQGVPFTLLYGRRPDMHMVKTFGTKVWVGTDGKRDRKKLDDRAMKCVVVGIDDLAQRAYRCLHPAEGYKLYISRNVHFASEIPSHHLTYVPDNAEPVQAPFQPPYTLQTWDPLDDDDDADGTASSSNGGDTNIDSEADPFIPASLGDEDFPPSPSPVLSHDSALPATPQEDSLPPPSPADPDPLDSPAVLTSLMEVDTSLANDPSTLQAAMESDEWPKWEEAIDSELSSLEANGTWTVVDLPEGCHTISAKWVFKTKRDQHGNVSKHKARLVGRGFTQIQGIDYNETYSPVVTMPSLRAVLCYGLKNHFRIRQIDFVAAYLNGDLEETIYMVLPPGYEQHYAQSANSCCKLNKAIYGLKQSGRQWYAKLDTSLTSMGFTKLDADIAVYRRESVAIAVYVDDMIITGTNGQVDAAINALKEAFKITGGDNASWCLGIHINYTRDGTIRLSQESYVDAILKRFSMDRAESTLLPLDPSLVNLAPDQDQGKDFSPEQLKTYRQIIGSVMYLMVATRPDLAYPVSRLASYLAAPTTTHMKQARHLLRFIKTTKVVSLTYSTQESGEVVAFADADHAGSWEENPHSTSGYVALMFGGALAWRSCKQRVISTSTAEAEVVALSDAARELSNLVEVLKGLDLVSTPVKLFTDNQAAHRITTTDGPQRNKALTLRAASVKDLVDKGEIAVDWISGELQRADGLTKVLTARAHKFFRASIGVISLEELRRR
jgi:hypothetical protein